MLHLVLTSEIICQLPHASGGRIRLLKISQIKFQLLIYIFLKNKKRGTSVTTMNQYFLNEEMNVLWLKVRLTFCDALGVCLTFKLIALFHDDIGVSKMVLVLRLSPTVSMSCTPHCFYELYLVRVQMYSKQSSWEFSGGHPLCLCLAGY